MKPGNLKLHYVELAELERWPRNPKDHDEDLIRASILRFGFNDPMAVDETSGKLVEGHGRLSVLRALKEEGEEPPIRVQVRKRDGAWLVPVLRGIAFESEQEAEAYIIGHNRSTEAGGWVDGVLAQIFEDMENAPEDIYAAMGFDMSAAQEIIDLALLNTEEDREIARKKTPEERFEVYTAGEIKQIVLYLDGETFDKVVPRMARALRETGIDNNTELFLHLLQEWEAAHPVDGTPDAGAPAGGAAQGAV